MQIRCTGKSERKQRRLTVFSGGPHAFHWRILNGARKEEEARDEEECPEMKEN